MPNFNRPTLTQIVSAINRQNPDLDPPLRPEWCELTNPTPIAGTDVNTTATLRIADGNPHYQGQIDVTYRRLRLNSLLTQFPVPLGVEATTYHEVIQAWIDHHYLPVDVSDFEDGPVDWDAHSDSPDPSVQFTTRPDALGVVGSQNGAPHTYTTPPPRPDIIEGIPGRGVPLGGDHWNGFFGEVSSSQLFTVSELFAEVGLSTANRASDVIWLKFRYQGRILFVAKQPISTHLSWGDLYEAGVVYGSTSPGSMPFPELSLTPQQRRVTRNARNYEIRLLSGYGRNPMTLVDNSGTWVHPDSGDVHATMSNEFDGLLNRINRLSSWVPHLRWANYPPSELGTGTISDWMANVTWANPPNGDPDYYAMARQLTDDGTHGVTTEQPTVQSAAFGWRPVLEYIS